MTSPPGSAPEADDDVRNALAMLLEDRGHLKSLRASLHRVIFEAVAEDSSPPVQRPPPPPENLVLNTLILDYLTFNGFTNAAAVLATEAGHPTAPSVMSTDDHSRPSDGIPLPAHPVLPSRTTTAVALGLPGADTSVPLLYTLAAALRTRAAARPIRATGP
eukprot:TRINITY_DN71532_c0_g1_i1.p1 TRINITY_DN71532_c0_g1~~TRINITY_DN71532_c0_g1_i1.p1  ORF type:complete len:161 (-),score=13.12 TRINITY_DN71532_c0_g1_i1:423-905(-)